MDEEGCSLEKYMSVMDEWKSALKNKLREEILANQCGFQGI